MNDTSPKMYKKMCELIQMKTPDERVRMGASMCETSRSLVTSAILEENPNISKADFKKELFLKYYRDDFDFITREKIIKYLIDNTNPEEADKRG